MVTGILHCNCIKPPHKADMRDGHALRANRDVVPDQHQGIGAA